MSEVKILKEYKTRINGICVVFKDVPYQEKWGSKVFLVNFHSKELEKQICFSLLKHRPTINGGILKFIRHYFDFSLQKMNDEFFDKTKSTIADWESALDKPINIDQTVSTKIYFKLLSVYQSKVLDDLLSKTSIEMDSFTEDKPLDLRNSEESYYEVASC